MGEKSTIAAAAARLLRRHVVGQRELIEQLSEPAARLAADTDADPEPLRETFDNIRSMPSGGMQMELEAVEDGTLVARILFEDDPYGGISLLIISAYRDRQMRPWTVIASAYLIDMEDEDQTPEDVQDLINTLNDRIPGGVWNFSGNMLRFITGTSLPGRTIDDPQQLERIIEHLHDAAAWGSSSILRSDGVEHPARARERESEKFQQIIGNRWQMSELQDAVGVWLHELPDLLAAACEMRLSEPQGRTDGASLLLDVPYPVSPQLHHLRILFDLPGPDELPDGIPQGIHAYCSLPGLMSGTEADAWCSRLNGSEEDDDGEVAVTTGWWYGNWYRSQEDEDAFRIIYFAVIPHKYRPMSDLAGEVRGIVTEVCSGYERIRFAQQHALMMAHDEVAEDA